MKFPKFLSQPQRLLAIQVAVLFASQTTLARNGRCTSRQPHYDQCGPPGFEADAEQYRAQGCFLPRWDSEWRRLLRRQCGQCGGSGCGGRGEGCCAGPLTGPDGRPCRHPRDTGCVVPSRGRFCQRGQLNGNLCCPRSCQQCGGSGCGSSGSGCCNRDAPLCRTFGETGCRIPGQLASSRPSDCSAETCTWFRAGVIASSRSGSDFDQVTTLIRRFGARAGEVSACGVILSQTERGVSGVGTVWMDGWQRANGFTSAPMSATDAVMDCILSQDVFITSHRNQQLEDRNGVLGVHPDRGNWQRWRLSSAGDGTVFITSHRNQQLEDRNGVVGLHPDRFSFQTWLVTYAGGCDTVFITSHRNQQLEDRNGVLGVHPDRGNWQRWRITTASSGLTITASSGQPACVPEGAGAMFTSAVGSGTQQSRRFLTPSQWDHVFFYSGSGVIQALDICERSERGDRNCHEFGLTASRNEATIDRLFIPVQQGEVFRGFYGRLPFTIGATPAPFLQLGMYWGPDVWGVPQVVQVDPVRSPDLPPPPPLMWMPVTRNMFGRCRGLGRLLCPLSRAIGSIARGAVRLIRTVGNIVARVAERVVELAVDLFNDLVSVGQSLAQGIMNFILDPVGTIRNFLECLSDPQRNTLNLLPFCGEGSSVSVDGRSLSASCTSFLGGLGNLGRCFRLCTDGSPFSGQSARLPGTESEMEMLGSAMTRPDESTDMRGNMSTSGNGCQGGLNISIDVNAELDPSISMSVDLSGEVQLTIEGMAHVSIQALLEAAGSCAYRANRSFPERPPVKTACLPPVCVVVSLQAFAEVNVSGMLTGSVAMRARADLQFSTTVRLRADRPERSNVQSESSTERSAGLEVVASAEATVQIGVGPHLMIWLVPGPPVDILPLVVAEARGSGTFEFLQEAASNRRLLAAPGESGNSSGRARHGASGQTSSRSTADATDRFELPAAFADESGDMRSPSRAGLRGAPAMPNSSSHESHESHASHESSNDSPILLQEGQDVAHAERELQSGTLETCVGFAVNVRGLGR